MVFLSKRVADLARSQCRHGVRSLSLAASTSARFFNRRRVGASYSSLAGKSSADRNAIVTGSSRGIGKAVALRLAADGYNICVNDISANQAGCDEVAEEIRSKGRKACIAIADVSKRDEVKDIVQTSVDELGPLNTMVANAGIAQVKALLDLTEQDFRHMFEVNVFGVQNCFAEAAKQMISQGNCVPDRPGKLISAASIVAFKPFPLLSHYSASKWAVRGLTQAYAMELAEHNITVNAYAPGIVGTAMWELIDAQMAEKKGMRKGEVIKKMVHEQTALGRVSVSEDVAKLVSFLASSDSDFVTGQTQVVDGGIIYT
ncbi:Uu.00g128120.m01.CDS01 [Anthostomella pinea]|uniref:Uu.00g128120.m01.CDS01 n=1 Tax=Anthostomella pinea TaxID=933095 RepID=A0AAI8VIA4_9PEZI|nr:Uu.00g128120.m01.CDS01 [Anthostomella pinea]